MTVIVGVDGSPDSLAAIRLARQEAGYRNAGLTAVIAYASDTALGTPAARPISTPITPDEQRTAAESIVRRALIDAIGTDEHVELRAIAGMPGRVLVQAARAAGAQLIVLATRREHAPSRLLGPVSQYVLRNAPCPVLVVPEASKEL
ncbi:MAG TPA: universal stress protein [Streptosporangiaceae bacterium]|jgi:nucleotide-binding universal stress UspA family protein|nr:universal stress protein [Streptosporangiaceae bacterium]